MNFKHRFRFDTSLFNIFRILLTISPSPFYNVECIFEADHVAWYHGNNIVFGGEGGVANTMSQ